MVTIDVHAPRSELVIVDEEEEEEDESSDEDIFDMVGPQGFWSVLLIVFLYPCLSWGHTVARLRILSH